MGQVIVRERSKSPLRVSKGTRVSLALLIFICPVVVSCAKETPKAEAPPLPVAQTADEPQQPASNLPPPELNKVQEAVKRVFQDSAVVDTSRKPAFIAGDFNGDQWQDVAVVLKPAPEKLSDLNEEFASWILRDPFAKQQVQGPRLRVAADDVLLAVIHGYGPNGWHDTQATQTYLLKNAVGSSMQARQAKDVATSNKGQKQPRLSGDVIGEVVGGTAGYLYYAGASYSWYDPKTFKGDAEPGMFHGVPRKVVKK